MAVEDRVYLEHSPDDDGPVYFRPDASIHQSMVRESAAAAVAPVTLTVPMPERVVEHFMEIRRLPGRDLVTVIEVLSPANKRANSDGRSEGLKKREQLQRTSINLVELDLLRGGMRLPTIPEPPPADYYALICRGNRRPQAECYAWMLRTPLSPIPIPLASPVPDAKLDIGAATKTVYERAGFEHALDYGATGLKPPLAAGDAAWAKECVGAWKHERM